MLPVSDFLGDMGQSQWQKYKRNFVVECAEVGLLVEFHWAPILHSRALDLKGWMEILCYSCLNDKKGQ